MLLLVFKVHTYFVTLSSPPYCTHYMVAQILQSTLKHFCNEVKNNNMDKVVKFVEKGLDPNFVDQDTGGMVHIVSEGD